MIQMRMMIVIPLIYWILWLNRDICDRILWFLVLKWINYAIRLINSGYTKISWSITSSLANVLSWLWCLRRGGRRFYYFWTIYLTRLLHRTISFYRWYSIIALRSFWFRADSTSIQWLFFTRLECHLIWDLF